MSHVLDLDAIQPKPVEFKLGGKEFKIEKIPFEFSLSVYNLVPFLTQIESGEAPKEEDTEKVLKLITDIINLVDKTITLEWVRGELIFPRFEKLMPEIMTAMFQSKKNEEKEVIQESS